VRCGVYRLLLLSCPQINPSQSDLTRMDNFRRVVKLAEAWYS
jgi:hypothetical protein